MRRKPLIAGNWKMYKTQEEAIEFVRGLLPVAKKIKDKEIFFGRSVYLDQPPCCRGEGEWRGDWRTKYERCLGRGFYRRDCSKDAS